MNDIHTTDEIRAGIAYLSSDNVSEAFAYGVYGVKIAAWVMNGDMSRDEALDCLTPIHGATEFASTALDAFFAIVRIAE